MRAAAAIALLFFLQGCGVYQILGPRWVQSFDEFTGWADDRGKIEDWMKRCTRYSQEANWGWDRQPNPGDKGLTRELARSLWKHKRGACGQYAAMFVWCGIRNRATCGFIYTRPGEAGGHLMAWIEEPDGTVTRTDNKDAYRSEYGSRKHMQDFWLSRTCRVIIYDGSWNVIKQNFEEAP